MNRLPHSNVPSSSLRRRALQLGALLLCAAPMSSAFAAGERYEIDPEHVTVAFLVEHIGYAKTLGQFRKLSGGFSFDEATGKLTDLRVVIDAASVDTGHAARDGHLRGKDFLDVARFPRLTFTASSIQRRDARRFVVEGELELLGRRRPVTLEATLNKSERYPIGPPLLKPWVVGVSARGRLKRSDFGMSYGIANGLVGDEVELIIELEARRQ
jgi:polyisoprenoid-binding protein YceI